MFERCSLTGISQGFLYAAELDSPAVVPNRSERNQRCQTEPGASCLPPRQLFEAASPQSAQPHQQTSLDKLKFDLAENVQIKRVLVQSAEEELSRLTGEQNDLQQLSAPIRRVCEVTSRDICDLDVPMHRARLTQSDVYAG